MITINDELEFIRINRLKILEASLVRKLHFPRLYRILNRLFQGSFRPNLQYYNLQISLMHDPKKIKIIKIHRCLSTNKVIIYLGPALFEEEINLIISGRGTMPPMSVGYCIVKERPVLVSCKPNVALFIFHAYS